MVGNQVRLLVNMFAHSLEQCKQTYIGGLCHCELIAHAVSTNVLSHFTPLKVN